MRPETVDAIELLRQAGLRAIREYTRGVPAECHIALHNAAWHLRQESSRYDEAQTRAIESIRERMRSIAVLAVQSQDCIGSDKFDDLLQDIANDLRFAEIVSSHISCDRVYIAEEIALTGNLHPERK